MVLMMSVVLLHDHDLGRCILGKVTRNRHDLLSRLSKIIIWILSVKYSFWTCGNRILLYGLWPGWVFWSIKLRRNERHRWRSHCRIHRFAFIWFSFPVERTASVFSFVEVFGSLHARSALPPYNDFGLIARSLTDCDRRLIMVFIIDDDNVDGCYFRFVWEDEVVQVSFLHCHLVLSIFDLNLGDNIV